MLILVPTPIGNLKDITLRALETLQSCDVIICEDTRRTSILLNHYQIKKPLLVLNDFQENKSFEKILSELLMGKTLALVSDAGTPLISDPGFKLVRECIKHSIPVDSLPGPSAITTALTLSTLPSDKFFFLGYFPEKTGQRQKFYQTMEQISHITPTTFIIFSAPFKIQKPLQEIQNYFNQDLEIVIANELSKIHQSVHKAPISEFITRFKQNPPKGEFVVLIHLPGNS